MPEILSEKKNARAKSCSPRASSRNSGKGDNSTSRSFSPSKGRRRIAKEEERYQTGCLNDMDWAEPPSDKHYSVLKNIVHDVLEKQIIEQKRHPSGPSVMKRRSTNSQPTRGGSSVYERLYGISSLKQIQGKEKRTKIEECLKERAASRNGDRVKNYGTIPISKARDMYDRGMIFVKKKEEKCVEMMEKEHRALREYLDDYGTISVSRALDIYERGMVLKRKREERRVRAVQEARLLAHIEMLRRFGPTSIMDTALEMHELGLRETWSGVFSPKTY